MISASSISCLNLVAIFIIFANIAIPSLSSTVKRSAGTCGDWCYDEEDKYPDFTCADNVPGKWIDHDCITGERQSPIDIPEGLISASSDIFLSPHYAYPATFEMLNNGHTAAITPLNPKDFILNGTNFDGSYIIAGLHFHWGEDNTLGSEHKLSGKSFTLELHVVHHKEKYEDLDHALASDDPTSVAVLGVFFEIDDAADIDNDDLALKSISDLLETVQESDHLSQGFGLKIVDLIPSHSEIFNYNGSLTTPCCNQNVFWTVFKTPLTVSVGQMTAFRNLKYHNGHLLQNNYRGPQPLNARTILQTDATVRVSTYESNSGSLLSMPVFSIIGFILVLCW